MNQLTSTDYAVFLVYFVVVAAYGYWIYEKKRRKEASTTDFFLAEGALTWWAIGASLIASNISAEQFIGMSGSGFRVGVAIAAFEWIAALSLIIVGVFFMPIYLKNRIYTMPQFLERRYNESVAMIMTVFWLFLYVFVNLTSILFLGALAISNVVGDLGISPDSPIGSMQIIIVALALFATIITMGGMKVIGYTDVIQVVVLIVGGLATTYIALTLVAEHFGLGKDAIAGFQKLLTEAPDHFHLIIPKPGPDASPNYVAKYLAVPAGMYFAGQWIANLYYWGCNQYITQRALGAELETARKGLLFAGFLKLLMPVIVMLPGIAAYVLYQEGKLQKQMAPAGELLTDNAYSAILGFLPVGLRGLAVAALTAAIVASLAGKANSIATIYTLDIYRKYVNRDASEQKQVWIGRLVIFISIIIAVVCSWSDLFNIEKGGFDFIQKYTGYVSPGIVALFILGMFWRRTTAAAAMVGMFLGFFLSIFFNDVAPYLGYSETPLYTVYDTGRVAENGSNILEIPYLICMGWSFAFTVLAMVLISLLGPRVNAKAYDIDSESFKVSPVTGMMIAALLMILAAVYVRFW
jgi:SSS family solute:Na+ symporter